MKDKLEFILSWMTPKERDKFLEQMEEFDNNENNEDHGKETTTIRP